MEGEGVSVGSAGSLSIGDGTVSGGGGSLAGASLGGGGIESIGAGSDSIGGAPSVGSGQVGMGSSISIFESLSSDISEPGVGQMRSEGDFPVPTAEPVVITPQRLATVESGILDAVREAGTPEAGLQFLADVSIVDQAQPPNGGTHLPGEMPNAHPGGGIPPLEGGSSTEEVSVAENVPATESDVAVQQEIAPLSPEQNQAQNYVAANPEVAGALGNVISLTPEALATMMIALRKLMEEEAEKAKKDEEEKPMSKKMMALLAFFLLIELMFKAAEKGAKEATR